MKDGKIVMMWEGNNGTYWCKMQYWIGVGYQYVDYQVDEGAYTAPSLL